MAFRYGGRKRPLVSAAAPRDTQRSRVYSAERMAFPEAFGRSSGEPGLQSIPECQAFITRITRQAWYKRRFPDGRWTVTVGHNQGRGGARGGYGSITISGYYRNRVVLLHELAHNAVGPGPWRAGHGWEFAKAYLDLVRHVMGREDAAKLAAAFKAKRVRTRPKRTRAPLTDEQRAALAARLAGARAARQAATAAPEQATQEPEPDYTPTWPDAPPDRRLDIALALATS